MQRPRRPIDTPVCIMCQAPLAARGLAFCPDCRAARRAPAMPDDLIRRLLIMPIDQALPLESVVALA